MKATYLHAAGAIALTFTIAACVPTVAPPVVDQRPMTTPAPVSTPAPAPAPSVQRPQYDSYLDAPQTPGTWQYGADPDATMAWFGTGGSENQSAFIMLCQVGQGEVWLARRGSTTPRAMQVTTETTVRLLEAAPMPREGNIVVAKLSANDTLLDAMAVTKGRFAIQTEGLPTLYLPAWAEVTRVIEDCR